MTPLEITRRAQAGVVKLELFPGLFNTELQDFPNQVPCRIPPEIAELLGTCRGFYGTVDQVECRGFYGTVDQVEFWGRTLSSSSIRYSLMDFRSRQTAMAIFRS